MENGLSSEEATRKLAEFGPNTITATNKVSPFVLFLTQFRGVINAILAFAALVSFLIGDRLESVFIFAVIVLNALFSFIQEFKAEKSLEKLKSYTIQTVRAIRDGKEVQIPSTELVPGDLVLLSEGDRIPGDGRLSEAHNLEIDESILTGESLPVGKEEKDEVFTGTLVVKGNGMFFMQKTGMETRFGQIAQSLSTIQQEQTPLQKQLAVLGRMLSALAVILSLLVIPFGYWQGRDPIDLLFLAVSLAIAAIPEGLTAIITIALAVGTNRMAKRDAIVRKMPSVETLGAVQVILTDKTGTLTQNKMRVKVVWQPEGTTHDDLLRACLLGNTASVITKKGEETVVGDQTDGALLLYALDDEPELKREIEAGTVVDEYTFDTKYKTVTTTWKKNGTLAVFTRGAPEVLLANSTVSDKEKAAIEQKIDEYAGEGLRVIAFGMKRMKSQGAHTREKLEQDQTFLGIVGIYDPPREEVQQAIMNASQAGIRTIMVTGDNELTATSIARDIGLISGDHPVLTGENLVALSDTELRKKMKTTRIFARTKPEDKLRLVSLLTKQGYVVGVTGDGVNDSLALKQASVGIAMGKSGTDVAKEASDIILADDNFATLIRAIEEGRTIYRNIVKAIMYLLVGNLSEISLVLFSIIFGLPPVLLPTQILWINLVTDGLPALALAIDTKDPNVLRDKPRNPKEHIITKRRASLIILGGLNIAAVLTLLYILLLPNYSVEFSRTIVFNALIVMHLGMAFFMRGQSLLRPNKFLILAVSATIILQIIISTIPVFQDIFQLSLR